MRGKRIFAGAMAAVLTFTMCGFSSIAATNDTVYAVGTNGVVVEAEALTYNETYYSITSNDSASGGAALQANTGESAGNAIADKPTDGRVDIALNFNVETAGEYHIWVRYSAKHLGARSFYSAIDDGEYNSGHFLDITGNETVYNWARVRREDLSAGTHTFKIAKRQHVMRIDQIIVTPKVGYVPAGIVTGITGAVHLPEGIYNEPLYNPTANEHPRVMFRASDIPTIKSNLAHPENALARAAFETDVNKTITIGKYHNSPTVERIVAKAFYYALYKDTNADAATKAEEAIAAIKAIDANDWYSDMATKGNFERYFGGVLYTLSRVYDWCYELLDADEREQFIEIGTNLALRMETGWPPQSNENVIGHGSEYQLLRDLIAFSIATYDERPDIWKYVGGIFYQHYAPFGEEWNKSHYHHQGTNYGMARYDADCYAYYLITAMGAPEPYSGVNLSSMPYTNLYMLRPDGRYLKDGDMYETYNPPYNYLNDVMTRDAMAYLFASSIGNNGYMKNEYYRTITEESSGSIIRNYGSHVTHLIVNKPDLKATANESLPLSKYFGSPMGVMVARTGWEDGVDSDSVVAEMKIGESYLGNHQHLDAGTFQIYYKGPLAMNAAIYRAGTNAEGKAVAAYGNANHMMYSQKSISKNTILVFDPDEGNTTDYALSNVNDGGQEQKHVSTIVDVDTVLRNANRATVEAHEIDPTNTYEPDYSYIKGDITNAYSNKVSEMKRSFMFLNLDDADAPAAMVIFDKVQSSDATFKKAWLLHSIQQPVVEKKSDRTVTTVKRDTEYAAQSDSNNQYNAFKYNGKMQVDTLLPAPTDLDSAIIGGEGNWSLINRYKYNEATGTWDITSSDNFAAAVEDRSAEEEGYRLELSPKTPATDNYFLNVIQVGDADNDASLAVTKIDNDNFYGAQISDRAVMFSKSGTEVSAGFTVTAPAAGELKYTICDMAEGVWDVNGSKYRVTADGGVLAFTSSASTITVSPSSGTVASAGGAAPTVADSYYIRDYNERFIARTTRPVISDNEVYVSIDDFAKAKGLTVKYEKVSEKNIAKVYDANGKLVLWLGEGVNHVLASTGIIKTATPAAIMADGKFMLSQSVVAQVFGYTVVPDDVSKTLFMNSITRPERTDTASYVNNGDGTVTITLSSGIASGITYMCAAYSGTRMLDAQPITDTATLNNIPTDSTEFEVKLYRWADGIMPIDAAEEVKPQQ